MFLLLLAAAADPATLVTRASDRLSVVQPVPRRESFRVEHDADAAASTKDRAIAEDGARCSVVGARVCTRKPRTWLKMDVDPRP